MGMKCMKRTHHGQRMLHFKGGRTWKGWKKRCFLLRAEGLKGIETPSFFEDGVDGSEILIRGDEGLNF